MAQKYELIKGSVVFFEGEKNNKLIYLLRSGKLVATSYSFLKKEDETRSLKIGEFFGLKSTLTDKLREETIQVLESGEAITFTQAEFNEMLKKNIKILLQLLISFSNDMLTIHRQIESTHNFGKSLISDREKMLENAQQHFNNNTQAVALYTFKKYKELYPGNIKIKEVDEKISMLENTLSTQEPS